MMTKVMFIHSIDKRRIQIDHFFSSIVGSGLLSDMCHIHRFVVPNYFLALDSFGVDYRSDGYVVFIGFDLCQLSAISMLFTVRCMTSLCLLTTYCSFPQVNLKSLFLSLRDLPTAVTLCLHSL